MDDVSILVYLFQIMFVGGWIYTLIMGLILIATGFLIACIILGVLDNYRKDKMQENDPDQELLKTA